MSLCAGFLSCCAVSKSNCTIKVHTGDYKGASTNSNVYIVLYDEKDQSTQQYKLDNFLHNDFKCDAVDSFDVELPTNFSRVVKLQIWHDNAGFFPNWYVEIIKVKQSQYSRESIFPIFRWIVPDEGDGQNHYIIMEFDTILPQFDKNPTQRYREIESKRQSYDLKYVHGNVPMVKILPADEQFSADHKKNVLLSKFEHYFLNLKAKIFVSDWTTFDDIIKIYDNVRRQPASSHSWSGDAWFGNQRLVGCNPSLITLCTEIPEKFGVTEEMMEPVLHNETLASLMEQKRLFYTDLAVVDGLKHNENFEICSPMALFMLDDTDNLLPIAIQLNQEKGSDNPVFLPTDNENVWLLAKLWYNNADASFHQSVIHLGWTHLLMEGVTVAMKRNISMSHPIMKLLEPHTFFLLAVNSRGLRKLFEEGGWVDFTMNLGVSGVFDLISRCQSKWRIDVHGTPPVEFKSRNVEDPKVLPNYHFRDDSLLIYGIISNYVTDYVHLYYDDEKMLWDDWEMQNWAKDLARDKSEGGIGLGGVPVRNGEGGFNTIDELIMVLSAVIYTCSAGHAAANFLQYDEYGYPPNYPSQIRGKVIKDKEPLTEQELVQSLPNRNVTLDIMTITDLLSNKTTQSLGDFEIDYVYDPKALKILDKFRADLRKASVKMMERNRHLLFPYEVLLPENIPNAISI